MGFFTKAKHPCVIKRKPVSIFPTRPSIYQFRCHAATFPDGRIWVSGGSLAHADYNNCTTQIWEYWPETREWFAAETSLPVAMCHHGSAVINNGADFIVFGGSPGGTAQKYVYSYNFASKTWTQRANLATAVDGPLVVFDPSGNMVFNNNGETKLYTYNGSTWAATFRMNIGMYYSTPAVSKLANGKYLIASFNSGNGESHLLDLTANTVVNSGNLPSSATSWRGVMSPREHSGTVVLVGGEGTNSLGKWIYTVSSGTWALTSNAAAPVWTGLAAQSASGEVVVIAGIDVDSDPKMIRIN